MCSSRAVAASSARGSSSGSVARATRSRSPARRDYDLTSMEATGRLFDDTAPELVFHLAAEVGGIGANRSNPGRYWYANLMMGAHILEQARLHGTPKLVIAGTICAYPKFAPVPFHEEDLWNGYPEETNAPYGVAKKAILVGAQSYREQYGTNAIFLLPVNLYGPRRQLRPRDVPCDPRPDPEDGRGAGASRRRDRALGRRHADPRVPLRRRLRRGFRARGRALRRDGAREPRHGRGNRDPRPGRARPRRYGFRGRNRWDTSKPNGQPRRRLDTSRAEALFGFRAAVHLREGIGRTVAWYRESR